VYLTDISVSSAFTQNRNEIDLVEERDGKLFGYELKWKDKTTTAPKEWFETYGNEAEWELSIQISPYSS